VTVGDLAIAYQHLAQALGYGVWGATRVADALLARDAADRWWEVEQ